MTSGKGFAWILRGETSTVTSGEGLSGEVLDRVSCIRHPIRSSDIDRNGSPLFYDGEGNPSTLDD